ncbi:MAG: baseplate J/gp47 family protein [Clostridia bacterium]|nr:baseplate J/gp47 family protein [Clostridia bacterium]
MQKQFEFIGTDGMIEEAVSRYEELTGRTLNAADPDRLFLSWAVSALLLERARANYIGNQNIPSRAEGENLDALAEFYYLRERPQEKAARCVMRFTLTSAQTRAILVPAGTRVTDEEQTLFWATEEDCYIPAGSLYADTEAVCETPGVIGNGWEAGSLSVLVDPYMFASDPENTAVTDGGADRADDKEFYELMRQSMDALSTAGPRGAYEYHAKAVSGEIADVKAIRPGEVYTASLPVYERGGGKYAFLGGSTLLPDTLVVKKGSTTAAAGTDYTAEYEDGLLVITISGSGILASETSVSVSVRRDSAGLVELYALMKDGTAASSTVKAAILAACSAATVRPLTDQVSVKDPVSSAYNINLTYYIPRSSAEGGAAIEEAVEKAVEEYVKWQSGALGRDINPSVLIGMLMDAGIKRVVVTSPTFTPLSDGSDGTPPEYASVGTVTTISGGLEDW